MYLICTLFCRRKRQWIIYITVSYRWGCSRSLDSNCSFCWRHIFGGEVAIWCSDYLALKGRQDL